MSEKEQDSNERTEQPTLRRLEKAKEKGQIPQSKDLYHLVILSGCLLCILWKSQQGLRMLLRTLKGIFVHAGDHPVDGYALLSGGVYLFQKIGMVLGIWFGFLVVQLCGELVQTIRERFRHSLPKRLATSFLI